MTAARDALERHGARLSTDADEVRVVSFGNASSEADALRGGAGLLPRPGWALWEASGAQAFDYLHRMTTQDLRSLAPGAARYACVLTREGRLLADPVVWHLGDRALLSMAPRAAAAAIPPLERLVVADDVVFADRSADHALLVVAGPLAAEALRRALGVDPPAERRFVRTPLAGREALLLRRDEAPRFEAIVEAGAFADSFAHLASTPGITAVGEDAHDALRVETGLPAYGAELDERVLPNEAGLEAAVSWTKGCYVGQEPVVMAKHRGHPPSLLCRLKVEGPAPARDAELLLGGQRAGRVTTAVPDPTLPGSLALGYVRWADARESTSLRLADGTPATVTAVLAPRGKT